MLKQKRWNKQEFRNLLYAGHLHCQNMNVFFVAFTAATGTRLAVEVVVAVEVEASMEDRYEKHIKQTNNRLVSGSYRNEKGTKEFGLLRDTARRPTTTTTTAVFGEMRFQVPAELSRKNVSNSCWWENIMGCKRNSNKPRQHGKHLNNSQATLFFAKCILSWMCRCSLAAQLSRATKESQS